MPTQDADLRAALRRLDAAIVRQERFVQEAIASELGGAAAKPLRDDLALMRAEAARLRHRLLAP